MQISSFLQKYSEVIFPVGAQLTFLVSMLAFFRYSSYKKMMLDQRGIFTASQSQSHKNTNNSPGETFGPGELSQLDDGPTTTTNTLPESDDDEPMSARKKSIEAVARKQSAEQSKTPDKARQLDDDKLPSTMILL
jgi:hypothetical protein